jgi:hypothetical protein
MISKQQLGEAMVRECDICLHLFGKLRPGALEYRPSPGQRSTAELLRYLSVCGIAGVRAMANGDFKLFREALARVQDAPADAFPAAMEEQKADLRAFFETVTEETLERQQATLPGGGAKPLGVAILEGPLKWLTGYKLQLFLYAKATGAHDIGTANAWAGIDWKG